MLLKNCLPHFNKQTATKMLATTKEFVLFIQLFHKILDYKFSFSFLPLLFASIAISFREDDDDVIVINIKIVATCGIVLLQYF